MSDLNGIAAQSVQDEEVREGELLCLKIRAHLEDMLSDGNLEKDSFLLKHIQKNKQGYVSLKLLTCLKKIKALTTNWSMTLAAAECSTLLEVNEERTKVRRRAPLPPSLMCSPTSRLLLIWCDSDHGGVGATGNSESLSLLWKILLKFTSPISTACIQILHPGEELPKELQCYSKRHKELGQRLCAVVKFVSLEAVRETLSALKAEEKVDGKGLCVVPLGYQSMQCFTKFQLSGKKSKKVTCSEENLLEVSKVLVQQEPSSFLEVFEETSKTIPPQECQVNSMHGDENFTNSTGLSFSRLDQEYCKSGWSTGDNDEQCCQCPWVLRRKFAAIVQNPKSARPLNKPILLQRVLRQPFGPDGTKGFQPRTKR